VGKKALLLDGNSIINVVPRVGMPLDHGQVQYTMFGIVSC
jgi:hypothetical protein